VIDDEDDWDDSEDTKVPALIYLQMNPFLLTMKKTSPKFPDLDLRGNTRRGNRRRGRNYLGIHEYTG
jgi:hypothetical protein